MPKKSGEKPALSRWPFISGITIYAIILVSAIFYGTVKLQETDNGQKIKISVVQGNIEQDKKWDKRFQREVIDKYKELTIKASESSPDIIVWPETALPFIFDYDKSPTEEVVTFQKGLAAHLLFGSVVVKEIEPGNSMMANSAVLLSPEGSIISIYDKMHLVPYGEYVPLRKFFPFIEKLTVGIGDFYSGKEPVVMETPFAKIGNLICYEIIFPGLARQLTDRGANILVTITNDAWFGHTSAPYQHFSMAVFRAIENRVPVARAANTGISGFIDSHGRIIKKSDIFVESAMTESISLGDEKSFYTRNGDLFAYFCIFSSVVLITRRLLGKDQK
jgi:apolipoprotein N-acyltransferase